MSENARHQTRRAATSDNSATPPPVAIEQGRPTGRQTRPRQQRSIGRVICYLVLTPILLLIGIALADAAAGGDPVRDAQDLIVQVRADPIENGQLAKRKKVEAQAKVQQQIALIVEHLAGFDGSLDAEVRVLEDFRALIPQLRAEANWLVENYPKFQAALDVYQRRLNESPALLRRAAAEYRARAEDVGSTHQGNYEMLARDCELGAARLEQEAEKNAELEQTTAARMVVVRESIVFCRDFENFLLLRDDGQHQFVAEFLAQLNLYLANFEQTVQLFQELSIAIDQQPEA